MLYIVYIMEWSGGNAERARTAKVTCTCTYRALGSGHRAAGIRTSCGGRRSPSRMAHRRRCAVRNEPEYAFTVIYFHLFFGVLGSSCAAAAAAHRTVVAPMCVPLREGSSIGECKVQTKKYTHIICIGLLGASLTEIYPQIY